VYPERDPVCGQIVSNTQGRLQDHGTTFVARSDGRILTAGRREGGKQLKYADRTRHSAMQWIDPEQTFAVAQQHSIIR
jgi:hypothetical protein